MVLLPVLEVFLFVFRPMGKLLYGTDEVWLQWALGTNRCATMLSVQHLVFIRQPCLKLEDTLILHHLPRCPLGEAL